MRTIQEKYNAIAEGNFSKSQFVKDAKRELSQFLSPFNGYDDTVSILKNKGIIYEVKKEVPQYDKPEPGYSIETIERGVDYELEAMGLMSNETVSEEDYGKAKKKAEKNLKKDPNHYLHLLSGDSKKVDKHDQMVPVKKGNHVDTFNGLKKAQLKEEVDARLDPYEDRDVILKQVMALLVREKGASREELKGFISTHMEDILNAPDDAAIVDEFEQYISVNNDYVDEKKGKDHDGDGDIDGDDYMMAKDKAIKGAKKEGIHDRDVLSRPISNPAVEPHSMPPEMAKDHNDSRSYSQITSKYRKQINDPTVSDKDLEYILGGSGNPAMGGTPGAIERVIQDRNNKSTSEAIGGPDHQKLSDMGYSAGEKALMSIDGEIFKHPNFDSFVSGFMKGFQDNMEASQDYAAHYVNEGRRRKMKGGKIVTENDYETGGYVESMGPRLDKALKALTVVWDEWKNGPATEPGMVPFAKKDLVSYIDSKILEADDIEEDYKPSHRAYNVIDGKGNIVYKELPRHTAIEKASEREDYGFVATDSLAEDGIEEHKELKEAFKAIITKVLQEEIISEAATGNLSRVATSYDDFEGMQTAVNSLENVVTEVESFYAKTKEKIQKVYDSFKDIKNVEGLAVGAMLAPAIESAFKKDLIPVTEKGFTKGLEMPKVKVLETDGIAEEELDEKETVFTPINEALNKELKAFGPDLMKRLKTAGFQTGLFKGQGQVPNDARMKIIDNPKLAGIAYKRYPDGYEFLEVSVQREKGEELEKVAKYFSTPEGQYGPDKDAGWVIKNVRNVNPGDIYRSKLGGMNGLATITYFRAEEAGTRMYNDKIKSKDKLAAEGKKYKYSKRK